MPKGKAWRQDVGQKRNKRFSNDQRDKQEGSNKRQI